MIIIPFGDNQARGDLAGSVIYQRRRGQVMCRKYAVPKNPRSADQMKQRRHFSAAVVAWQALSGPEKESWRSKAAGMVMTGYNLFIRNFLNGYFPSDTPLSIMDITNLNIKFRRGSFPISWAFTFNGNPIGMYWGRIYDNENSFYDGVPYPPGNGIRIRCVSSAEPFGILAGDYIEMWYNTSSFINIYLPAASGTAGFNLYVADDGSTYYDSGFTMLAQGAPPPP
jgi:hypothetical protein